MNDKINGAPMAEDDKLCPSDEATEAAAPAAADAGQQESAAPETETQDTTAAEAAEVPSTEPDAQQPDQPEPKKNKSLPWILGGCIVVLIAIIVTLVITMSRKDAAEDQPAAETTTAADEAQPGEDTAADNADQSETDNSGEPASDADTEESGGNGISYTVSADALTDDVLDQVVASCGDDKLTNRDLPYYYWQQYYSFMNSYGSYAAYFLDSTKPFDQQMCLMDDTITWQQYFLQNAVNTYCDISALWQDARLAGFQLSQENQDYLSGLETTIATSAVAYGFDSADAYLQTAYGPSATMNGYRSFIERYLMASEYLQALVDAKTYTQADISAYYDERAEEYAASGIEKDDTNMVNVRHILITPTEQNEDGTYTDEAWAAAEQKAQELLRDWQSGEHTEDSFAVMAADSSDDPGSASNGGLYEDVYPGQMVEAFNDWCFDAARKPGDTGIVKTDNGYHIMYFSSTAEYPHWYKQAENDYLNALSVTTTDEITEKYTAGVTYDNAALADILAQD